MAQTLSLKPIDQPCTMKQSIIVFLVVYLFYPGKSQTSLPPETSGMSEVLLPEGNVIAELLKDLSEEWNNLFKPYSTENLQSDVIFQLYTRSHPNIFTTLAPTEEAIVGDFNSQRQTKFIIHGWRSNGDYLAPIRKGYLEAGDYNVIVVDWSKLAHNFYFTSIYFMQLCGEYLASLIDFLVIHHGLRLEDVHIIGHSLGGQMAGIAGNRIKSGNPGRITGLDPAMPGFCSEPLENRLDSTDGQFVDVIHTCAGLVSWKAPIGHADFYPNGGTDVQPGCEVSEDFEDVYFGTATCSHARSHEYFAESITSTSGFVSYECPSWNDFKHGKCFQNSRALMGEFTDTSSRGSYYLQTAKSSPFALGSTSRVVDVDSTLDENAITLNNFLRNVTVC